MDANFTHTAQTVSTPTVNLPDLAGATDDLVLKGLTQALANKTLTTPVISAGLSASGSASNDFSASTGQFLTSIGLNTFGGFAAFKTIATPVAAAGSSHSDAAALGSANIVTITSDSAAKGVKLNSSAPGQIVFIINTTAVAAKLYPHTSGTISGLGINAPVTIGASHIIAAFSLATDIWYAADLGAMLAA